MKQTILTVLAAAGMTFASACAMDDGKLDADDTKTGPNGKAEHWGSGDSPTTFASDVVMTLEDLPQTGEANLIPWAGYYWPVAADGINKKWDGSSSKSPSEKYAVAFNRDVTAVMNGVSSAHGIDSQSHRKACTSAADCSDPGDGQCSKREGEDSGYCIPTWFGICHAWAPVSILLPEPLHEVEHNGVTFKVQDVKALVTQIYNSTVTRFVSLRCNTDSNDINFDNYGRPTGTDSECRDTNPGTLHLLLTNYLGIRGEAFVEDRTYDDEVWNQPIRGYRITQQDAVTARQANELIGVTSAGGTNFDAAGTLAKDAWFHMDGVAVTNGQSVSVNMTGTGDADLYVRFGSQPTASAYDCRPYAGGSAESCNVTATSDTQVFVSVLGYADTSDYDVTAVIGGSVPDDYQFNANATEFRHVKIDVDYITESPASADGNLGDNINQYTNTDHYEYILELKKNNSGQLIVDGGEYIGASKKNHPDFLWLPVSHRGTSVANGQITRANVMTIYEKSRQTDTPDPPNTGDNKVVEESGTVAKNIIDRYGPFAVAAGESITVVMTGTNDADLYLRSGSAPTSASYDCRPYKNGSAEECTFISTGAPIHVGVMGYAASSDYDLRIEYVEGGGSTPPVDPPPTTEVTHLNVQDSIAQGEMKHFTIALPAGYATKIETFSSSDIDLYIQLNQAPTESEYLGRGYTATGNETLSYTPQANATLHIMVHGYAAADSFTLRTSAQ